MLNSFTATTPRGTNADFRIISVAEQQRCSIAGPCLEVPCFHDALNCKRDPMLLEPRSLCAQYAAHLKLHGIPAARHTPVKQHFECRQLCVGVISTSLTGPL
jgi:hypothetical protein